MYSAASHKRSTPSMGPATMLRLIFVVCAIIYLVFIIFTWISSFSERTEEDKTSQSRNQILENIRENYLILPPSGPDVERNYKREIEEPKMKQMFTFVSTLLGDKKNGFFVEAGAWDGGELSNSLYFEKKLEWTGLLVEPHPVQFKKLKARKRDAFIANACIGVHAEPQKVIIRRPVEIEQPYWNNENDEFWEHRQEQKKNNTKLKMEEFEAQCFSLYDFLLSLGKEKDVDYLSLDVDGNELEILKTIPWHKVSIKTISVEVSDDTESATRFYMEDQKYVHVDTIADTWMRDSLFIHSSFLQNTE